MKKFPGIDRSTAPYCIYNLPPCLRPLYVGSTSRLARQYLLPIECQTVRINTKQQHFRACGLCGHDQWSFEELHKSGFATLLNFRANEHLRDWFQGKSWNGSYKWPTCTVKMGSFSLLLLLLSAIIQYLTNRTGEFKWLFKSLICSGWNYSKKIDINEGK